MELYGVSARRIADLTGVSEKTARRWKRDGLPALAAQLLEIRDTRDLGALDEAWAGFKLSHGELWTPEQVKVSPGQIRSLPYRLEQLRTLERLMAEPRQLVLL